MMGDYPSVGQLPAGISMPDARRLVSYAEALTKNAAGSLAAMHLLIDPPSIERDFYMHGLTVCAGLSPASVQFCGEALSKEITDKVPGVRLRGFVEAWINYYEFGDPIPSYVPSYLDMPKDMGLWLAFSDVEQFAKTFMTKIAKEDDSRSILACLGRSLNHNNLVDVYNAMDVVPLFDEEDLPQSVEFWTRPEKSIPGVTRQGFGL